MKKFFKHLSIVFAFFMLLVGVAALPDRCNAATIITSNNLGTIWLGEYQQYRFNAGSGSYICGFSFTASYGSWAVSVGTQAGQSWYTYEGYLGASGFNGGSYIVFATTSSPHSLENLIVYVATEVADNSTVIQARDAANSANTNALNAYSSLVNGVGNNGKSLSATWDQAAAANTNAGNAAIRTWDTLTSKSAATLAREARDNAATANTKLDTIQTSITNIQNNLGADVTPPVVKIRTVSGALATSGSSIRAVLDISDNAGSDFTYSLDGTSYTPVPADGKVFLPLGSPGPNVVTVWVKDQAGNIGRSSITIRRL